MRTTIDLPDDLFRQAKARAALDGVSFKELVTKYLDQGLNRRHRVTDRPRRRRSDPPIVREPSGQPMPVLSNAQLQLILDAEEAGRGAGD